MDMETQSQAIEQTSLQKPLNETKSVSLLDSSYIRAKAKPTESPYNSRLSRKFVESLCGLSTNTLVRYEQEGIIHPVRLKHGALELITYDSKDTRAIVKHRNIQFKKRKDAEVIAVFSQKGGVGKSAFTQHLASMLSLVGKVLVIDIDSQADLTTLLGVSRQHVDLVEADELEPTIMELMDWTLADGGEPPYQTKKFNEVVKTITPSLDVIAADLDLAEVNYSLNRLNLKNKIDSNGNVKPQVLLMIKEVIDTIRDQYDFILFDCPPNIETCNLNALFAANRILIPVELEAKCLKTMKRNEDFLKRIGSLHEEFNWDKILVVPNKFKRENIKIKALAKLQDIYAERTDVQLSQAVFPHASIIDKCSEAKEPIFVAATKFGKEFKADVPRAKEFTNLFWVVMHELLDVELDRLLFDEPSAGEA